MKLLAALLVLAPALAFADYQGDLTMTPQSKMEIKGHLYGRKDGLRIEITEPMQTVNIIDFKSKKAFMLQPEQKTFMEISSEDRKQQFPECADAEAVKCLQAQGYKKSGSEKIDGHSCTIWERTRDAGQNGKRQDKLWQPTDIKDVLWLRFVSTGEHGEVQANLTNVKVGALDDALFKVPAGYTKSEGMPLGPRGPGMGPGMRPGPGMTQEQMQELMKKYGKPQQQPPQGKE